VDAVIISDPGILMTAKTCIPDVPIHLRTQANTTHLNGVLFWEAQGVRRVNLAREVPLNEIKEISKGCSMEVEAFVHGALCIAYSGRCLLSSFMAGRESNRGMCAHCCRWKYAIVEEKRPGEYMPIHEDARGTYIFNSRDLCMIKYLPEMIESGVASLKIEGRMKGINYVASTVKVYREAIDAYYMNPDHYIVKEDWIKELSSVGPRGYCTGFYFGDPSQICPDFKKDLNAPEYRIVGKVIENAGLNSTDGVHLEVRNKIYNGDIINIFSRSGPSRQDRIIDILDEGGRSIPFAQPGSRVVVLFDSTCLPNDLIRSVGDGAQSALIR